MLAASELLPKHKHSCLWYVINRAEKVKITHSPEDGIANYLRQEIPVQY